MSQIIIIYLESKNYLYRNNSTRINEHCTGIKK